MLTKQGVKAEDGSCNDISDHTFGSSYIFKTCYLDGNIPRDFSTLMVSKQDISVQGMFSSYLRFQSSSYDLSEGIGVKFPYLKGYEVLECQVEKISITHFNGMRRLQILVLKANKIKSIMSGTFRDLTALEYLDLCEYFLIDHDLYLVRHFWVRDFIRKNILMREQLLRFQVVD
jgi:Leucine rich repeat